MLVYLNIWADVLAERHEKIKINMPSENVKRFAKVRGMAGLSEE
jgi:hypothetical protein